MIEALLALAALALLAVITVQDVIYAPFRDETVSQGLNGPWHVALDAALGLLAIALIVASLGRGLLLALAILCALGLAGVAVTNTAWRFIDGLTGRLGGHEPVHLAFTALTFIAAFAFECVADRGALWGLTAASVAVPAAVFALSRRQDYAEKAAVLLLCIWLIAWALHQT